MLGPTVSHLPFLSSTAEICLVLDTAICMISCHVALVFALLLHATLELCARAHMIRLPCPFDRTQISVARASRGMMRNLLWTRTCGAL